MDIKAYELLLKMNKNIADLNSKTKDICSNFDTTTSNKMINSTDTNLKILESIDELNSYLDSSKIQVSNYAKSTLDNVKSILEQNV